MSKIVINTCYGGFGISNAAYELYAKKKGLTLYTEGTGWNTIHYLEPPGPKNRMWLYGPELERNDPILIEVIEELGEAANGDCADLKIIELEPGTAYRIEEYDGFESLTFSYDDWKIA